MTARPTDQASLALTAPEGGVSGGSWGAPHP
jgi:hypothetical protein